MVLFFQLSPVGKFSLECWQTGDVTQWQNNLLTTLCSISLTEKNKQTKNKTKQLGVVMPTCNASIQETKARESQV